MKTETEHTTRLMTRKEAARHITATYGIPMSPLTLDTLASTGGGPIFCKFGRRALYDPGDIEGWVKKRMTRKYSSTSDEQSHA